MDERELEERLQAFGLSEKQAVTYLTILRHGEAKASVVADDAGVSKRYVYSISEELEERGFVEVNDHVVPTVIEARPPDEVLAGLTDSIESLRPALNDRFTETTEELEQFEVVKSRVTVEKRLAQLVGAADREVALSIPGSMLDQVRDELAAAVDRGVAVLLVLTDTDQEAVGDVEGVATVARAWRERVPMLLTADGTYGLVAPVEMLARANSDMQAISLAQPQLVPVLSGSLLGNYWPMAHEVHAESPAALPATFRGFRHAVLQATLHLRAGTDLGASVEARPVLEDGEYRTIPGEVVDVRQSLVAPANNSFPVENTLVVDTGEETVTVGGPGAFVEDYEAREVVLDTR